MPAARPLAWLGFVLALVGLGWVFRAGTPPAFADRRDAVTIGSRARELGAPALWIDTPDYSYLAVTAAYGRPNAAEPFAEALGRLLGDRGLRARMGARARAVAEAEHGLEPMVAGAEDYLRAQAALGRAARVARARQA